MTTTPASSGQTTRFRLSRAGILNIWQYDDQVFTFADGRLLLRGSNGAGKSKTLEMLLPFAIDGDRAKMSASAKQRTSLFWLMTDGYDGPTRLGYVWVEFARTDEHGRPATFTCGVGVRASVSAGTVACWYFATDRRVGVDFALEDDAGPLPRPRLEQVLGADQVFERQTDYKEHVGRTLFGLDADAYTEVLRLLYWLRQPQIGEDVEPARLAHQLSVALPQVDEAAVRTAGDAFDELAAFGEQIDRRAAASEAISRLADAYAGYARATLAVRARQATQAINAERQARSVRKTATAAVDGAQSRLVVAVSDAAAAVASQHEESAKLSSYEASPEFRNQTRLGELSAAADAAEARADKAEGARQRADADVHTRVAFEKGCRDKAQARLAGHVGALHELDRRQRAAVPGGSLAVPAVLDALELTDVAQVDAVCAALDQADAQVEAAQTAVRQRRAGVALVREAVDAADRAEAAQGQAERVADAEEARWERARQTRLATERAAQGAEDELRDQVGAWVADPAAPADIQPPDRLTSEVVEALPQLAREAAAADLGDWYRRRADAQAAQAAAETETARLRDERAAVAAQRDPAPPAPTLRRTERRDGAALWQAVDFAEGLAPSERAGLEAALQASGLLDAWIRPGGRLLDADDRDLLLRPSEAGAGLTGAGTVLNAWLTPDPPEGCGLTRNDVERALACVGAGENQSDGWVGADGSWRLGPTVGRADKDVAQYIGATARAAERARRIAVLDAALAEQQALATQAQAAIAAADEALTRLNAWVAHVPSGLPLLRAWHDVDAAEDAEAEAEQANQAAQKAAETARRLAFAARARLTQLAMEQRLPDDAAGLAAVEQALLALAEDLKDARRIELLREELAGWARAVQELTDAQAAARGAAEEARAVRTEAAKARAAHQGLLDSVGDSVLELQRKVAQARQTLERLKVQETVANDLVGAVREELGTARAQVSQADARLEEQAERRTSVLAALVAAQAVPGLVAAAGVGPDDAGVLAGLAGHPNDQPVPRAAAATVGALGALTDADPAQATSKLWQAYTETLSGAAADLQPAMADYPGGDAGPLYAALGHDDAGEETVNELARRTRAALDADRQLLTEREKRQFEQHILGELGEAIRARRREAKELVDAMNEQLRPVTTSQGIRVRLVWSLRDDSPAEVRSAVELLNQPVGALLPEERATLRDVLHRLIEASRAERPELSYAEHLAAALDYRTWYTFEIRYTRPERMGEWDKLHARSPLSQGEQKVLCYLPLFAAAAAHFTALAGAAPWAPRLVLLDDAFPKIDVRTHPLLFGLLVQLDLDFVITSERLWGDHATVPALAIYEALRDPGQRGIAQLSFRWDGQARQLVGGL